MQAQRPDGRTRLALDSDALWMGFGRTASECMADGSPDGWGRQHPSASALLVRVSDMLDQPPGIASPRLR